MLKICLGFKLTPYKVHTMQQLKEPDKQTWDRYCQWFQIHHGLRTYILSIRYIEKLYVSDWGSENPHVINEFIRLHSYKIGVWLNCCWTVWSNAEHLEIRKAGNLLFKNIILSKLFNSNGIVIFAWCRYREETGLLTHNNPTEWIKSIRCVFSFHK